MEHENHIGERTGVKDADRTLATEPSNGVVAPRALPSVTAGVAFEGGDGGAAASLRQSDGSDGDSGNGTAGPKATASAAAAPAAAQVVRPARVDSEELEAVKKQKAPNARGPHKNNVRKLRIERMMSKAELARRANLSVLTIDRVEKGFGCRMDSKRKILEALGLNLADRVRVFGEEE
jgi:DNA-binding XRE family transcriptional regulator